MTTIAVVDCETTGLDPNYHEVWEVAVILHKRPDANRECPADREFVWQLPVDIARADPGALRINHFYDRRWPKYDEFAARGESPVYGYTEAIVPDDLMADWAAHFAALTANCIVVGAVPSFDERRLDMLLRAHGAAPSWHYRPVCVETLAVGWLAGVNAALDALSSTHAASQNKVVAALWPKERRRARPPGSLPWASSTVAESIGVPRRSDAHAALADCRWALDQWQRVMEPDE